MGIHTNWNRFLPTLNGNVMTTGGSLNLAKGQLGVFDVKSHTKDGLTAISNFAGLPKSTQLQLRVGNHELGLARTQGNKNKETRTFRLDEVVGLEVNAPSTKKKVDELLIGYDGINPNTALTFETGDHKILDITLSGEGIGILDYPHGKATFNTYFEKTDDSQTNQEIVEKAVQMIKDNVLKEMVPVTEYIDVEVVNSEQTETVEGAVSHTYYNLTLTDGADSNALGNVQAQYGSKVVRTNQSGFASTYTILQPTADDAPAAFVRTIGSIVKGCEDCPSGFTAEDGGFLYFVTLEDDGADSSSDVENLAGAITDTAIKQGQNNGVGLYVVATNDEVTQAEIDTFITANPTATIKLIGETEAICNNTDTSTVAWVAGDVCNAITEEYRIQLKNDDCGDNLLTELQASYPDLVITVADNTSLAQSDITLTGTGGTANINIDGTDYLATFDTDLGTTASDFVASHAADIQTAHGVTVTANAAVLSFQGEADTFVNPTITNVTTDLAGTVENDVEVPSEGACQTVFSTDVTTNIVCEDCDPIFRGAFESEAPADFGFASWEKADNAYSATALMGIRIKGKETASIPNEYFRDETPFINSSVHIEAAGGFYTGSHYGINEGGERFPVKVLSRAEDLSNLGGELWTLEDRDNVYFNGRDRHKGNNYAKFVLGEESVLKPNAQYVVYTLKVAPESRSQGFAGVLKEGFNYMVAAEVGRHQGVEDILNGLAAAAGVPTVKAYGS